MKHSYEISKFNKSFIIIASMFMLAFICCVYAVLQEFGTKLWIITGIFAALEIAVYIVAVFRLKAITNEIQRVSDIMVKLVKENDIPSEPYMQGEVGELYTNLYKLVGTLKESRHKEQTEKIFLRDIISDISHQLKTPLASLNVFIDLLYDDRVMEPEKRRQILEESKNQLSRMEWMVLSMLKLARIEAGAIQFEDKPCKLLTLLTQAKEAVAYLTDARSQKIIIDCEENVTLVCDGGWLVEGIVNLLKNASDYSSENAEIRIEAEKNAMYTRIYVKDNGMGISEEDLPNIFKRFYRVNKEINPNSVGIGLALTKSIVEGMGGKISVRSELGKYSHFILTFVHV